MKKAAGTVAAALYRIALAFFAHDFGIGTSSRTLGPLTVRIDAPRELVFDVVAGPYLGRTPEPCWASSK